MFAKLAPLQSKLDEQRLMDPEGRQSRQLEMVLYVSVGVFGVFILQHSFGKRVANTWGETEQRNVLPRREANDKEHKFVASLLHSCHAYAIGCHRFTVQEIHGES